MKEIPQEFNKHKRDRVLLRRSEKAALYKVVDNGGYEVIRILKRKEDCFIGKSKIADKGDEFLASSSSWGANGFTYTEKEEQRALDKFEECSAVWAKEEDFPCDDKSDEISN